MPLIYLRYVLLLPLYYIANGLDAVYVHTYINTTEVEEWI